MDGNMRIQGARYLRADDLLALFELAPDQVLGAIVALNRTAHYHNSLNAIVLAGEVIDLQRMDPRYRSVNWFSAFVHPGQEGPNTPF